MVTRVNDEQLAWFRSWIENDESFPDDRFARHIVLLHPGTTKVDDDRFPFACPNIHPNANERLPEELTDILDRLLLETSEPQTPCRFALYAGYLKEEDRGASQGFHEPDATWHFGRLNYVLFAGTLAESTFGGVADHWGADFSFFQSLSYLWPNDRSWFLASTPDTDVTVIGCDDALAQKLLDHPDLDTHEWHM